LTIQNFIKIDKKFCRSNENASNKENLLIVINFTIFEVDTGGVIKFMKL